MRPRRLLPHWRMLILILAGSGLTALALWFANNLVFGGEARPLRGTPYTLYVQRGVSETEVELVVEGLTLADRYLASTLKAQAGEPLQVRLARRSPCIPFQPLRNAATAVANADMVCVQTRGRVWRYALREDPILALSIVAHEHLHTVQGQLGCLPGPDAHTHRWLIEGSATFVGWQALVTSGRTTQARVDAEMREWGGFSGLLKPLHAYERVLPGDPEYALSYRAVQLLVRGAGSPASLVRFCQLVGRGAAWHDAFRRAFGVTTGDFYKAFERARTVEAGEN